VTIQWQTVADTELPVLAYNIYMNDGIGGNDFIPVVSGIYPNIRKYTITNLTSSHDYGFKLTASNFNGESELSDAAYFTICTKPD
jgi:hypothetical protein